jgi:Purine catabolism regulatory protein-like family/PucR C-terminal helix-turn-helix domain
VLVGERLLRRQVTWVYTTDLRDPRRYLTGGELVLTGMMWRHDGISAATYVSRLVAASVAALGAGDPDLDELPPDLIEACRRHKLPLLHVRGDVSFSVITEYVVRRLSTGRSADLAAVLERHRSLLESAGGGQLVLDLVAGELGMSCWVLSPSGRVVWGSGGSELPEKDQVALAERAVGALPRWVRLGRDVGYSVFGTAAPVAAGWLLVVDDDCRDWSAERRAVVDQLVATLQLERSRQLRTGEADADRLWARAVADVPGPFVVAVASELAPSLTELAPAVLAELLSPYAWSRVGDDIVAVAADEPLASVRATAAGLSRLLGGHRLAVGVSAAVPASGLDAALADARHARDVGLLRAGSDLEVAGPDELTSHVMVLAAASPEVRSAFRTRVLGRLLEYDRQHRSDLVHTLKVFLACSGSWSQCAAQLHVHVNTLRYRIDRIEQLTARDLRQLPDLVDLYLALELQPPAD